MKFAELSARIGVKKAWDVKKIKEENVGVDFYSSGKAGTCGAAVARRGERPARTSNDTSDGNVAPSRMVPRDAQWRAEARGNVCHNALAARSLAGNVATAEKAPRGTQGHARTSSV